MPGQTVVTIIRKFLREVERAGIPVFAAVLYGSYARGTADKDSDIDLLVISAQDQLKRPMADTDLLWQLRGNVDYRIEPLLVTKHRWQHDLGSPLLATIRQEGRIIQPDRSADPGYSRRKAKPRVNTDRHR